VETLPQEAQVWQPLRHKNKTPKSNLSMVVFGIKYPLN
jgi:hypothetical protein